MANIIESGFIVTQNKRDNIYFTELREYIQANHPEILFKNAKAHLISLGAKEFKDNSVRGLKFIKFTGINILPNNKITVNMADSTNFLKEIPHAGLKAITKALNLHTIIRISKLSKDELVKKLATMTKIRDGKLVVSIPETELPIPSDIKPRKKAEAKPVNVSTELAEQIQMSVPKLINGLAKINELKDNEAKAISKAETQSLLVKKAELAGTVFQDTEDIVNKLNKDSDITKAQNEITAVAINYINESPAINIPASGKIDTVVLDNIAKVLDNLAPGLTSLNLDTATLDKIDTDKIPDSEIITVPREITNPTEIAPVSRLFDIDLSSMGDFSITNLANELEMFEEAQANYIPNIKPAEPEPVKQEYNPNVPKIPEERQAKLEMLRARAREAKQAKERAELAPMPVLIEPPTNLAPTPSRKLTKQESVADYNTLNLELRKLLEGKPVRQLSNSIDTAFLTFIPRDVINLIQNKDILRDLLRKTKNFIEELEPGPDDKVSQLAKGMMNSIELVLFPDAKRPKGRPKIGTGIQAVERDIRSFINTLSPEQRRIADAYINPGIRAVKTAIMEYITDEAPELNYAKLEPIASKPNLAEPERGKTTLTKFTYNRENKYYNAIRAKLDRALDENILVDGGFTPGEISKLNDLVVNYLFKDEIQLGNYTIDDVLKDKDLQEKIKRAKASYIANVPLSQQAQKIMDNFATDIKRVLTGYLSRSKTRALKTRMSQQETPAQRVKRERESELMNALAQDSPDELLGLDYVKLLDKVPYAEVKGKLDRYITEKNVKTQMKNRILRTLESANDKVLDEARNTYLRIFRNDKTEPGKVGSGYSSWGKVILTSGTIRYAPDGPMAVLYNIRKDYRKAKDAGNTEKMAQLVDKYISIAYKDKIDKMIRDNYSGYNLARLS